MNETMTKLARACTRCKKIHTLEVNTADIEAWKSGTLIQRAFPYLTAAERELLSPASAAPASMPCSPVMKMMMTSFCLTKRRMRDEGKAAQAQAAQA